MHPIICLSQLTKVYDLGDVKVPALQGVSLEIHEGEFVAVMGPSGSGKSTLMHLLGCLDRPTSGRYLLDGQDVSELDRDQLAEVRSRKIGFVFQSFHLLPKTTALENVELPLLYSRLNHKSRLERARSMLSRMGLQERERHYPSQLSGGQQQRVAIARALINEPRILLADEPTGNLDSQTSAEIMILLQQLNREQHLTVVLITHEHDIARYAGRVVELRDGQVRHDHLQEPQHALAPMGEVQP